MPFRARLKVRFGDIDHAGIVYYPRFLHYFHVALEEFFSQELGMQYSEVINERRLGFPTVHLEIDFHRPLRFGDEIDVEVGVPEIGTTSIRWRYQVFRVEGAEGLEEPAAAGEFVTVALDMDTYEKTPIPGWLREPLERYRDRAAAS